MSAIDMSTDPVVSQTKETRNDRQPNTISPLSAHLPEGRRVMNTSMLVPSKGLNAMRQNIAKSRGLLVEHQQHQQQQRQQQQWQKPAPSQETAVPIDPQSDWHKKMHRVKVLYAKGQYKECQALCKQLLEEREGSHTAVSKHISTPTA